MDEDRRSSPIRETFDSVASGYDSDALRFFIDSAKYLTACLDLNGDEHVLDVATGTGNAALTIARCLPNGRVTGIDFSAGMLELARKKAKSRNILNIDFREQDMRSIASGETVYDIAVCSFGIFFADDMSAQLLQIIDAVKPGGKIAITCFREDYFQPLSSLMFSRLASYGVQIPLHQPWKLISTEPGCIGFFEHGGLQNVRVLSKNVGYHLNNADEWWEIVWNAGYRRFVGQLSAEDQRRFKSEHLKEIDSLKTEDGIRLDVGVLFAIGTKP
jgi:ubiquinone/menaquinone biosynthesis C-methylase UbiE